MIEEDIRAENCGPESGSEQEEEEEDSSTRLEKDPPAKSEFQKFKQVRQE